MFAKALERDFCADWVLFDGWYATVALLKMIHRADLWFFTRVKKNRRYGQELCMEVRRGPRL